MKTKDQFFQVVIHKDDPWYPKRDLIENRPLKRDNGYYHFVKQKDVLSAREACFSDDFLFISKSTIKKFKP